MPGRFLPDRYSLPFLKKIIIFVVSLYSGISGAGEKGSQWISSWEHAKTIDGIMSECRQHRNKINQCKFITVVDESVEALSAVIADVDNFTQWAVSVQVSEKMPPLDAVNDIYVYTVYHFTGAYDRYAVSRYTAKQDPKTQAVKFSFITVDKPAPHVDLRLVKFPLMAGYWQFRPLRNGKTEIEHMSFVPPGGVVQKTLYYPYNIAVLNATFETIVALVKQAKQAKYQGAKLSFIKNTSYQKFRIRG